MQFKSNELDIKKFEKLLDQKEKNIFVASLTNEIISSQDRYFNQKNIKASINSLSNLYLNDLEEINVFKYQIKLNELDIKNYINNPYINKINKIAIDKNNYHLKLNKYKAFELFISDEIEVDNNNYYKEYTNLGYFNKDFTYLSLDYKNDVWMLISPNEINTMNKHIELAHGNILTFGLGLGYFQYMTSRKNNVNKIYIIEKDTTIIDIFNNEILPQFENKDKIIIIQDDAFNFIKNNMNNIKFDYAFIDLYHNPNDGLEFYLAFKAIENKYKNATFSYWLDTSLIALVRRIMISLLIEQYEELPSKYYNKEENIEDKLINYFYYKTKELTINSFKEILDLITDESLNNLLKSFVFTK